MRWPSRPDTTDTTEASRKAISSLNNASSAISNALARLRVAGREPLLVIAAGNAPIDATYSGFTRAAANPADSAQIIVVGGIEQSGTIDDSSSFGRLVSVYAPSNDVAALAPGNAVALRSGTSAAAPLVAGTAGLLLSFDSRPQMTAAEMKRFIVSGAVAAVVEPNGTEKPVLNAYGALKKAALQPGSGTCGNRVWAANDSIYVRRAATNEAIAHAPGAASVTAGHGSVLLTGSAVEAGRRHIAFRNGGWISTTEAVDPYDQGSPERSAGGYSHDRDSLAFLEPDPDNGWSYGLFATVLHSDTAIIPTAQRTLTTVPMSQLGGPGACAAALLRDNQYECFQLFSATPIRPSTNFTTDNETPVLAYSSLGDEVLVAVPHLSNVFGSATSFEFTDCPTYGAGIFCRSFDVRRRVDSTVVWSVQRHNGAKARLFSVLGQKLFWLILGSDADEIAAIAGPAQTGELFRGSAPVSNTVTVQLGPCTTQFFRRDGSQGFSVPGANCAFANGTLAPKRRLPWVVSESPGGRSRAATRGPTRPR